MTIQAFDNLGLVNQYLNDESLKIPKAHLEKVCQYQQKNACKYIALIAMGFVCCKNTPLKEKIDEMVEQGYIKANNDNCEGFGEKEKKDNQGKQKKEINQEKKDNPKKENSKEKAN